MDKVTLSTKNITPFGGLNFVLDAINKAELPQTSIPSLAIEAQTPPIPIRISFYPSLATHSPRAVLSTLKLKFSDQIFGAIPSPDTLEYAYQELKTKTIVETLVADIKHELNYNQRFNESLVALSVKTGQLKSNEKYTLDFDNVVIANEKQDAKKSYKNKKWVPSKYSFHRPYTSPY